LFDENLARTRGDDKDCAKDRPNRDARKEKAKLRGVQVKVFQTSNRKEGRDHRDEQAEQKNANDDDANFGCSPDVDDRAR
jgi:hypothetical protein